MKFNTTPNLDELIKRCRNLVGWLSKRLSSTWVPARYNKNIKKNLFGRFAILIIVYILIWVICFAPITLTYLGGLERSISEIVQLFLSASADKAETSFSALSPAESAEALGFIIKPKSSLPDLPPFELFIAYASMILLLIGVPFGILQTLRKYRGDPVVFSMVIGAATIFLVFGVRFASSRGGELMGRAWPFLYLFVAFILANGLLFLTDSISRIRRAVGCLVFFAILILFVGGIASGWPPYWSRLPGKYAVGAAERSVDIYGLSASTWAREHLKHNSSIATDFILLHILGSYGLQAPVMGLGAIFLDETLGERHRDMIEEKGLDYLVIDTRISEAAPRMGFYYGYWEAILNKQNAVPLLFITKFDSIPDINRIYDNGAVIFYDVRGLIEK